MRRSLLRLSVLVCAVAAVVPTRAHATTFLPVTFDDLIAESDVIFVGEVVDVHAYTMQTREGTIVKTRVTFRVTDPLSGDNSLVQVLDFLGGEADGVGLRVSGMPTFTVGDRRIVFARRDQSINPIVGFTQGLMNVTRDGSGTDRVQTMRLDDLRERVRQAWARKAGKQ
jgi:hypothetical protein